MTRVCLDTSAYSNFRRGVPAVVNAIDRADWIGVPCVALGEIWAGFIAGSRAERNIAELEDFLAEPLVEVLAIDRDVAHLWRNRRRTAAQGKTAADRRHLDRRNCRPVRRNGTHL